MRPEVVDKVVVFWGLWLLLGTWSSWLSSIQPFTRQVRQARLQLLESTIRQEDFALDPSALVHHTGDVQRLRSPNSDIFAES